MWRNYHIFPALLNNKKFLSSATWHERKSMGAKFLQDIFSGISLFLDLAGSNLVQTLLNPRKVPVH